LVASCSKRLSEGIPLSRLDEKLYPYEQHFLDKQYPETTFPYLTYLGSLREARQHFDENADRSSGTWVTQGPGNIGARINTIAIHPTNENIILVGYSEGGAFRTDDGGVNWTPVFDDQIKLSVGDIAFDPVNPTRVYLGTGDPNVSGYPFIGTGIYVSDDTGLTWTYSGLSETAIISQIRVSETRPEVIYVSAMGLPFEKNQHRGVYKSEDRGQTWKQVLFVNDSTGIADLAIHPSNADIVYATGWNRVRNNFKSLVSGPDGKIFKTINGGASWSVLADSLPNEAMSRVGIDISRSNPDVLYACFTHPTDFNLFGIYKTTDAGATWKKQPIFETGELRENIYAGFGWYFGKIRVHPEDPDQIYILAVDMFRSMNSGLNWQMAVPNWWTYQVHADKHDLAFNNGYLYLATDGGLYKAPEGNELEWVKIENIPTTQFYRVAYNPHRPDLYYGGAQDNGTSGGNADQITNWDRIFGGDGFQAVFHPENPDIFYVCTQNGGLVMTQDGGQSYQDATRGLTGPRNWDFPYVMSPFDPSILYSGTNKVHKSTSTEAPDWKPVSDVLTNATNGFLRKNISSVAASSAAPGVVMAGTTDGMVWVTENDGLGWMLVSESLNGERLLPERYVTSVACSPDNEKVIYVSFSGYRDNIFLPLIYRSDDLGKTWRSIHGDLPKLAINKILILPGYNGRVIFAATDGGVYFTKDFGKQWERVGVNMPFVAVYDLTYNIANNEIVAGTFGRSIMSFDAGQLDFTSSSDDVAQVSSWKLYPAVSTGEISVSLASVDADHTIPYIITNAYGAVVKRGSVGAGTSQIDARGLGSGYFYFSVIGSRGISTKKFLIR
jgi:photosystem II stability/assembly factor-like uncharacterized protein